MEKTAGKGGDEKLNYGQKVKNNSTAKYGKNIAAFWTLSIEEYMEIQKRLLEKNKSASGQQAGWAKMFLKKTAADNRGFQENRSPYHLWGIMRISCWQRKTDMLPGEPVIWLDYMGGSKHPVKG